MDLARPWLLYLKGGLFVVTGTLAGGLLLIDGFSCRHAFLLAVCVWSFCRAYYFAFYVVQHYVDPGHRYAGLWAFTRYLLRRRRRPVGDASACDALPLAAPQEAEPESAKPPAASAARLNQ
jgi:hypothetical protein